MHHFRYLGLYEPNIIYFVIRQQGLVRESSQIQGKNDAVVPRLPRRERVDPTAPEPS